MRRLLTRMVLSHVIVAVLAALATVFVIREVAIRGWETRTQGGMAPGGPGTTHGMRPGGPGRGGMSAAEGFRQQVIASIDQGASSGSPSASWPRCCSPSSPRGASRSRWRGWARRSRASRRPL